MLIQNIFEKQNLPINAKHRLHGLSIEERVKNGTKTLRGRACEAVTSGMGGYYLTWESDVLSASRRQGLYLGHYKSQARDSLLHHLNTTGRTEFDALSPLMLHASGENGPARFIGRMLEPAELMLSKFAWMMLSPEEQATHWLGSLVSRRRNGKLVYEPVWTVYPYLIVDACDNWDLNVSHFIGPDKFGKLGAPGQSGTWVWTASMKSAPTVAGVPWSGALSISVLCTLWPQERASLRWVAPRDRRCGSEEGGGVGIFLIKRRQSPSTP